MTNPDKILQEMEGILKELISTAEQLKQISTQVVSEEDISPLQISQQELLEKLEEMDQEYQKLTKGAASPAKLKFEEMLNYFEKLNSAFIENIRKSSGLIEFELHQKNNKKSNKK